MTSSWEGWSSSWQDLQDEPWDGTDKPPNLENITQDEAGDELFLFLVELKIQGKLSAHQCCLLAWFADKAGAKGVAKLGYPPNRQSGKYSRHFDSVAGSMDGIGELYPMTLPVKSRTDASRISAEIPVLPPHEAIFKEVSECQDADTLLRAALKNCELPPAYYENPIVVSAAPGELVHPLCVYLDGVAFSRTDNILGLWCYHLHTEKRHLLAAIRRSELCGCGCKGWDTVYGLMSMLKWSFAALAQGSFPDARHDGTPFRANGDDCRSPHAGTDMGFKAICLFIKGDWAEYNHSLGLPSCKDGKAPCPLCISDSSMLYRWDGLSPFGIGQTLATSAHYEQACIDCEQKVHISNIRDFQKVRSALEFDMRKDGSAGRIVEIDIPSVNLQKYDRLEPTKCHPNVGNFEKLAPPLDSVWWKRSAETRSRRRNPLFCEELGIGPQSLCVDALHTLCLGVYQFFISHLLWEFLDLNVWSVHGSGVQLVEEGFKALKKEYSKWCSEEVQTGASVSKIQNFCLLMLGTSDEPLLKLHAAETNTFVRFADFLLKSHGHHIEITRLRHFRNGMAALMTVHKISREYRNVVPAEMVQAFTDASRRHMIALENLDIRFRPKHHFFFHMGPR